MSSTITSINKENIYGAFELKRIYPKNFLRGLITAVIIHFLLIGLYYFIQTINVEDEEAMPVVRIMKYSELGPPPSITNNLPPQVALNIPSAKPTVGIPIPVPDENVSPEQTIASQEEMNTIPNPIGTDEGTGSGQMQITQDIKIEDESSEDPDINAFVPVEKYPEAVIMPVPEYPEIARRAGITGKVWIKVLIDKEGKPKKAVIIKSDAEVFNDVSIAAAMKCVFTPALQNNHPIPIWVAIPFKFQLNN